MTSQLKIEANRRNAARSTGPRTIAGKARSGSNAIRHGLAIKTVLGSRLSEEMAELLEALKQQFPQAPVCLLEDFIAAETDILRVRAARIHILNSEASTKTESTAEQNSTPAQKSSKSITAKKSKTKRYIIRTLIKDPHAELSQNQYERLKRLLLWSLSPEQPRQNIRKRRPPTIEQRLAALDRYEDRALSCRGRVIRALQELEIKVKH
jgi:hypothetical protein